MRIKRGNDPLLRPAAAVLSSSAEIMEVAADPTAAGQLFYIADGSYDNILLYDDCRPDDTVTFRRYPEATVDLDGILFMAGCQNFRFEGFTFNGGIGPEDSEIHYGAHSAFRPTVGDPFTENMAFYGCMIHDAFNFESGCRNLLFERNSIDVGIDGIGIACVAASLLPGTPFGSDPRDDRRITDVTYRQNLVDTARIGFRFGGFKRAICEMNVMANQTETGGHADALQILWGGESLRITRNWMHDSAGVQGLFIKDGQCRNVEMANNLISAFDVAPGFPFADPSLSFYDCIPDSNEDWYTGFGMWLHHNTVWDAAGLVTVYGSADNDGNPGIVPASQDLGIDHNVFLHLDGASLLFHQDQDMMRSPQATYHDYNVYGRATFNWSPRGTHDRYTTDNDFPIDVVFVDAGSDDFRLDPTDDSYAYGTGVNWVPGDWPVGWVNALPDG